MNKRFPWPAQDEPSSLFMVLGWRSISVVPWWCSVWINDSLGIILLSWSWMFCSLLKLYSATWPVVWGSCASPTLSPCSQQIQQYAHCSPDIMTWDVVRAHSLQTQVMLERARDFGGLAFWRGGQHIKVVSGQDAADTVIGHIDTRRNMTKIRFSQFQAALCGGWTAQWMCLWLHLLYLKLALNSHLIPKNLSHTKLWLCVPSGREWPVEGWWYELQLK